MQCHVLFAAVSLTAAGTSHVITSPPAARAPASSRMRDITHGSIVHAQPYSFGSGYFGVWQEDELHAPVYNYTCDQLSDWKAEYNNDSDPFIREGRDHLFQAGNDRIVVLNSNFGYATLRSDEGGSKSLNDFNPDAGTQFGGGVGWMTSTPSGSATPPVLILSTLYNASATPVACSLNFNRLYGLGYMRKDVTSTCTGAGGSVRVVHDVVVPPHNASMLLSVVNITNIGAEVVLDLNWTETWSAAWWHYDLLSRSLTRTGDGALKSYLADFRNFSNTHYNLNWSTGGVDAAAAAISMTSLWTGLTAADEVEYARVAAALAAAASQSEYVAPVQVHMPAHASLWDTSPPVSALMDFTPADSPYLAPDIQVGNDCGAYFGSGSSRSPSGALNDLTYGTPPLANACMQLRRRILSLPPGATVTLTFGFAYTTDAQRAEGVDLNTLAADFAPFGANGSARADTVEYNLQQGYTYKLPGGVPGPWLERETLWHSYYTHAAVTWDDYFNESIVDQGTAYRYAMGFQGAARDPLQHALPFLFTRPDIARSVLLYTLKEVQAPGADFLPPPYFALPWGIIAHGLLVPWGLRPSDLEAYLLMTTAEYILATGDTQFLQVQVAGYNSTETSAVGAVLQHLFQYRAYTMGRGVHGFMRVCGSDWSDSFCEKAPGCVYNNSVWWDIYNQGESLLTTALFSYALQRMALALDLAGGYDTFAANATAYSNELLQAMRVNGLSQTGPWLRRAWLPTVNGSGDWQGETNVEITQQSWAVLSGALNASDPFAHQMAAFVRQNLSDPSPIGAVIVSVPFPSMPPYGNGENGGVWQGSLNMPYIWALTGINSTDAWEQYLLNTLGNEGDVYGDSIWAGIWSSSDVIDSYYSGTKTPGVPSWDDFPILCTHRHAWPLWTLTKIAGVSFDSRGVAIAPPPLHFSAACSVQKDGVMDPLLWSLHTPKLSINAWRNGSWTGHISMAQRVDARVRSSTHVRLTLPIQAFLPMAGQLSASMSADSAAAATVPVHMRSVTPQEHVRWSTHSSGTCGASAEQVGGDEYDACVSTASCVDAVLEVDVPLITVCGQATCAQVWWAVSV